MRFTTLLFMYLNLSLHDERGAIAFVPSQTNDQSGDCASCYYLLFRGPDTDTLIDLITGREEKLYHQSSRYCTRITLDR